jgi:hypothetical protein
MFASQRSEDRASRPGSPAGDIFRALPNRFINVVLGSDVQQALIGFSVLNHELGFAVNSEDHGPLKVPYFSLYL